MSGSGRSLRVEMQAARRCVVTAKKGCITFDGPTIHGSVRIVKGFGLGHEKEGSSARSNESKKEASAFSCFTRSDMALRVDRRCTSKSEPRCRRRAQHRIQAALEMLRSTPRFSGGGRAKPGHTRGWRCLYQAPLREAEPKTRHDGRQEQR